jgi:hypothetical protein
MTGWEDHGGLLMSNPAVVSWGANRLDFFVRGADSHLYHQAWDGSVWVPSMTGWEDHGGMLASDPVVVSWGTGRLDIFVTGPDSHLYHQARDGSKWVPALTGWEDHGGAVAPGGIADVSVLSWGANRLDIFVRSFDSHFYHQAWDGSKWVPSMTGWEDHGGRGADYPGWVGTWGPDRYDLVTGAWNNHVWHQAWNGTTWVPSMSTWEDHGGLITDEIAIGGGDPTAWTSVLAVPIMQSSFRPASRR